MIPRIINIVDAELKSGHTIHLKFDDGTERDIDFAPFLSRSQHPDIRAFLDISRFSSFRLEHGELIWGDYELCFPNIDLYLDNLDHRHSLEEAV